MEADNCPEVAPEGMADTRRSPRLNEGERLIRGRRTWPPTFRKCRVARSSGESASRALAHCSASGVRASRHSWQTSELILITRVKEATKGDTRLRSSVRPRRGHRGASESA